MSVDWDKFDKQVDIEGLKKDVEAAAAGGGNFEKTPHGTYEIRVKSMKLKQSKKGDPMFSAQFKIINGNMKNRIIFMNQLVTQAFQIHIVNEFLKSLDSGLDIEFSKYSQYANLILDVAEAIESNKLEYVLEYDENDKGYDTYKITDVFEG